MNPNEELKNQEAFDGAKFSQTDEKLYQMLFDELDKEPAVQIRPEFSAAVLKRIEQKKRRESRGESFLFGFAIFGVLAIALLAATFAKNALDSSPDFLKEGPLAPALLFAGLIILFQFIDKRFLRDHRLRRKLDSQSGLEL